MLRRSLLVLALLVAACGDDDEASTSATGSEVSTTEAPEQTTTSAPPGTTAATDPDPRPAVQVIEIEVVGGEPVGGPAAEEIVLGAEVSIQVTADVQDEVHLHGYDLTADVAPGVLGEITFTADIPGQFEVELEGSGVPIAEVTVS